MAGDDKQKLNTQKLMQQEGLGCSGPACPNVIINHNVNVLYL